MTFDKEDIIDQINSLEEHQEQFVETQLIHKGSEYTCYIELQTEYEVDVDEYSDERGVTTVNNGECVYKATVCEILFFDEDGELAQLPKKEITDFINYYYK